LPYRFGATLHRRTIKFKSTAEQDWLAAEHRLQLAVCAIVVQPEVNSRSFSVNGLNVLNDWSGFFFWSFPQAFGQRQTGEIFSRKPPLWLDTEALDHGHQLPRMLCGVPGGTLE
jgi:hypothetical protein